MMQWFNWRRWPRGSSRKKEKGKKTKVQRSRGKEGVTSSRQFVDTSFNCSVADAKGLGGPGDHGTDYGVP